MAARSHLRIVTTGLAVTYPLGGVFWDYLQYALGFARLGHEILYLEDSGKWCYDPAAATFVESGAHNAAWFAREIPKLDAALAERWFFRDPAGQTWGWDWARVVEFCRSADLFVHISASCAMRDEYYAAHRRAFIDSDPMFTQASIPDYVAGRLGRDDPARQRVEMIRAHDVHFTFGENISAPDCRIPRALFDWIPTRQPIVLECFGGAGVALAARRRVLTTVMSWEAAEKGPTVEGVSYGSKGQEFKRFIALAERAALPLEIAISGKAPRDELKARGWRLVEAPTVSGDPWSYRDYLAHSFGEWSVAKNAYVDSRSGWFSCRSACYLALGVPVMVQDTGFGCALPSGAGILKFSTLDEAQAAIAALAADPERHGRAARAIAREYFDSGKVLARLIDQAS
ncbi:MAG: glycosyltransferase family 1 protein [Candidatus Binataceae bacterium]